MAACNPTGKWKFCKGFTETASYIWHTAVCIFSASAFLSFICASMTIGVYNLQTNFLKKSSICLKRAQQSSNSFFKRVGNFCLFRHVLEFFFKCFLKLEPIATLFAETKVFIKLLFLRDAQFAQQKFKYSRYSLPTRNGFHTIPFSFATSQSNFCKIALPLWSRDRTVPIGSLRILAASW